MMATWLQRWKSDPKDAQYLILQGLFWCLVILHLMLLNRISSQFDELMIVGLFWYVLSQRLKKEAKEPPTSWQVSLIAYVLIACMMVRSFSFYWFDPTFLSAMPFLIVLAIALLTVGMRLWKFSVEFLFCGTMLVPLGLVNAWFEKGAGLPLQVLTAKASAFMLYYLGTPVSSQGTVIRLPQGAVNVELACTSFSVIFSLSQVFFLLILLQPLSRRALLWICGLTFAVMHLVSFMRVALLAYVVDQPAAFDFWHDSQGQQIISTFLILFLGLTYYIFYLREFETEEDRHIEGPNGEASCL